MKALDIKTALETAYTDFLIALGISEEDVMTELQNTALTDHLAGALESVNPTHNYPPVLK